MDKDFIDGDFIANYIASSIFSSQSNCQTFSGASRDGGRG